MERVQVCCLLDGIEEGESELALTYLIPILIIFTVLSSFKYILMLFPKFSELVADLLTKYQIGFILGSGGGMME